MNRDELEFGWFFFVLISVLEKKDYLLWFVAGGGGRVDVSVPIPDCWKTAGRHAAAVREWRCHQVGKGV